MPPHIDIDNYTAQTVKPDKIVYYPSSFNLSNFNDEVRRTMKISNGSTRLWVAATSMRSLPSHSNGNGDGGSGGSNGGSSKRARMVGEEKAFSGRLMTADITDLMGSPWRLLRDTHGLVASDLLGEQECVRILVEHHSDRKIQDEELPRHAVLQQWKRSLQVGDVVDAQDNGHWYEAVITSVHPSHSKADINSSPDGSSAKDMGFPGLEVHFKGWGNDFDEKILSQDVARHIQVIR